LPVGIVVFLAIVVNEQSEIRQGTPSSAGSFRPEERVYTPYIG